MSTTFHPSPELPKAPIATVASNLDDEMEMLSLGTADQLAEAINLAYQESPSTRKPPPPPSESPPTTPSQPNAPSGYTTFS
jgi:hypothetical protein